MLRLLLLVLLLECHPTSSLITARRELMPCTDGLTDAETNHHSLKNCRRKLTITLHIENAGQLKMSEVSQFVVVDRVYERLRHEEVMLYQPLVVALRQKPLAVTYPLSHLFSANAGPYEVVLNEASTPDYSGCQDLEGHVPQCVQEDEPATPGHAKGFCCGCDGNTAHLPYHARGGQDCTVANRTASSHTSAHCLKYHPIWYSVNEVGRAQLRHQVDIKVYQQQDDSGVTSWVDVTAGQTLTVGTEQTQDRTDSSKVSVSYSSYQTAADASVDILDGERQRLLIPEPSDDVDDDVEGKEITVADPSEYLVVDKTMIDSSGSSCDKVGVDHQAFLGQENACSKPQQSCLSNQPLDLWEQDLSLQSQNQSTQYFVTSYGTLSEVPMLEVTSTNDSAKQATLSFVYDGHHTSRVYMEINADKMVTLHKGSHGVVEEVSIQSGTDTTQVRVLVSNPGLVAAEYSVHLYHCQPTLHAPELHSSLMEPHGAGHFVFALQNPTLGAHVENATCTVMLINHHGQQVARRRIVIKPQDNCYCIAQCQCKCQSSGDLNCSPLGQAEYNQAGYKGQVPGALATRGEVMSDALVFTLPQMIVSILIVGVILGSIKMVVGMDLWLPMGQFGLCLFRDDYLTQYYEPELKGCDVVHDNQGTPINPHTGNPARLMGYTRECVLNILFFFYVPFIPVHYVISCCVRCCRRRSCVRWWNDGGQWCYDCLKAPCCCCRKAGYKKVAQEAKPILPRRGSLQDTVRYDSEEETTVFERRHFSAPSTPSKQSRWFILEEYRKRKQAAKAIQNVLKSSEGLSSALRMLESSAKTTQLPPLPASPPRPEPLPPSPPPRQSSPPPLSPPPPPTPAEPQQPQPRPDTPPVEPEVSPDVIPEPVKVPLGTVVTVEAAIQAEVETKLVSTGVQAVLSAPAVEEKLSSPSNRKEDKSATRLRQESDLLSIRKLCTPGTYAFYNYTKVNSHISKSGEKFSLCGHLRPLGNKSFKFTLGPELTQVFQNVDGVATPLTTPLPINPKWFQELLGPEQVMRRITLKPRPGHPCLNAVL